MRLSDTQVKQIIEHCPSSPEGLDKDCRRLAEDAMKDEALALWMAWGENVINQFWMYGAPQALLFCKWFIFQTVKLYGETEEREALNNLLGNTHIEL